MSGFINLDPDIIIQNAGQEIEYYSLWDLSNDHFFAGRSFIHGIYTDSHGRIKVYADLIWGDSLDKLTLSTEFEIFCTENDQPVYLGPTPFQIYRVDFKDEFGVLKIKYVPAESETDLAITIATFTQLYTTTRVNLDLTTYYRNARNS